jgi:hypothetical protein
MIDDSEFARRVDKLVDKGYCLGDSSKGFDCLNSLIEIYQDKFPTEYKGWNTSNYAQRWKSDEVEGRRVLEEFLLSLGVLVMPNYRIRSDLILMETSDPVSIIPIVDLGQGHGLLVANFGCNVLPIEGLLRLSKSVIKSVRRLF